MQRPRPPLIIGTRGAAAPIRLAAAHADEINLYYVTPAAARVAFERLDAACRAIGRDPGSVRRSVLLGTAVGSTPSDARARLADIRRIFEFGGSAEAWQAQWGDRWLYGTPDAIHAAVGDFGAAGADRIIFQDFLFEDLDMVDLLGELARTWTSDPIPGGTD